MRMTEAVIDAAASGTVPRGAIIIVSTTPMSVAAAKEMTIGNPSAAKAFASDQRFDPTGGSLMLVISEVTKAPLQESLALTLGKRCFAPAMR